MAGMPKRRRRRNRRTNAASDAGRVLASFNASVSKSDQALFDKFVAAGDRDMVERLVASFMPPGASRADHEWAVATIMRRRNRRNPGDVAYHFDWDDEEWTVFIKGDWHGNASSANDAVNEADAALQEIHGYSPKEADRAAVSAMESYLAHNAMEWDY